jgi:hypothetical protein
MKARIFDPLGMKTTTFDFQRALAANHATPHSWDIDGKTRNTPMDLNYSAIPIRPAAGAWSSANELIQYVRLELARGVAPSGRRLVSEQNILRRRQKSVSLGEDAYYGMGLAVSERYSVPLIEHGGGLIGMKSNMMWLPEHDVGAVFLSNSDEGGAVQDVFQRYLLELLFDAKPEALEDLATRAKLMRETFAKNRARLVVPIAPDARAGLAPRYVHETLGALTVNVQGDDVMFDFGEWRSLVASRKNPDSTTSVITISPGTNRFEFVQGKASDGKRQLTLRDDQHEYPFVEAPR